MNVVELKYRVKEKSGHPFNSPKDVFDTLKRNFNPIQEEFFLLPTVGQEFAVEKIFVGGLDQSTIDLRIIFHKLLVQYPNARAFLIAHNHPSGNIEASREDTIVTTKIREAADLLGYCLLDHIVFSNTGYYSFKDHNLL